MPPDNLARGAHRRHAMCAVGYGDAEQVFIIHNPCGADWGDRGYCYMPYDYLLNPSFNADDNLKFDPRVALPMPRDLSRTFQSD